MEVQKIESEKWICDFEKDVYIRRGENFNLGLIFYDYKTQKFIASCVGVTSDNLAHLVTFTNMFEKAFESFLWMEAKLYNSGFDYSDMPNLYKLKEKYKEKF